MGGKLLLRLNISNRPIANKYREGKMKSSLKRELTKYLKWLRGKCRKPVSFNHDFRVQGRRQDDVLETCVRFVVLLLGLYVVVGVSESIRVAG